MCETEPKRHACMTEFRMFSPVTSFPTLLFLPVHCELYLITIPFVFKAAKTEIVTTVNSFGPWESHGRVSDLA